MAYKLKGSSVSSISHNILHNRFVLYFVFIIAIGDLFYMGVKNDFIPISIFIASGLLTSFFSKNMVVILIIAIVVSAVIRLGRLTNREGFAECSEGEEWDEAEEKCVSKPKPETPV